MSASSVSEKRRPMPDQAQAIDIIENLGKGTPPKRGVRTYSVGHDLLLRGVRERHLESPSRTGKMRFVSGSWGSGKTHFLRELAEEAYDANYLVSSVELNREETPFNRFEKVFARIASQVISPKIFRASGPAAANTFGDVLHDVLYGGASDDSPLAHDVYKLASDQLMKDNTIDIDFRRMVVNFWKTYLAEAAGDNDAENQRGLILQWFAGEGTAATYRKLMGVQKIVSKDNARIMLRSLGRFALFCKFRGLLILFDEAEMSYSAMSKSNLKMAQNNLLHLINGVSESEGLFLVYATTPDFYFDPKHGIQSYGALASRIGFPSDAPPMPLDRVWNLDAVKSDPSDYRRLGLNVRDLYLIAYPEAEGKISGPAEIEKFVDEFVKEHPRMSKIGTWRALVAALVKRMGYESEGLKPPSTAELHGSIMDELARE